MQIDKPSIIENIYMTTGKGLAVAEAGSGGATGGTITTDGLYTVHKFSGNGTFTPINSGVVEYLIVGGGGGAASSVGGPGGGGGVLMGTCSITAQGYSIFVGGGGAGRDSGSKTFGITGGSSTFNSLKAFGGGGGGAADTNNGLDGGSGGGTGPGPGSTAGQGYAGPPRQGYNGGVSTTNWVCPGGGGAGQQGADSTASAGGKGGDGIASDIVEAGVDVYYGGGGGGAPYWDTNSGASSGLGGQGGGGNAAAVNPSGASGSPGVNGLGGGAGGGSTGGGNIPASASGGSGVVIIRYLTSTQDPTSIDKNIIKRTSASPVSGTGTVAIGYAGDLVSIPYTAAGFVKTGTTGILSIDTGTYLTDAPTDGSQYCRQDGSWATIVAGGGSGTVTEVDLKLPTEFNVSVSQVTTSGTLTAAWITSIAQNYIFAAPTSGTGSPAFRALVAADIPTLNQNTTGTATWALNAVLATTATYAVNAGTATYAVSAGSVSGAPAITSGTAAPTSTPGKIGDIYVDTLAHYIYMADGTDGSGNWVLLNYGNIATA